MDDVLKNGLGSHKSAPPSQHNAAAKSRAVALALQAFDEEKKISAGTQGSAEGSRFTSALKHLWSFKMNRKTFYRSAAAALVLFPAVGYVIHDQRLFRAPPSAPEFAMARGQSMGPSTAGDATKTSGARPTIEGQNRKDGGSIAVEIPEALAQADQQTVDSYLYRDDVGIPRVNRMQTDLTVSDASAVERAVNQKLAASQLAIIESMRLATGQMSGNARELTAMSMQVNPSVPRFVAEAVNGLKHVASDPVSTFSIDVDTASYAYARRSIMGGQLPPPDSVRVEEMVNYFPYDWQGPQSAAEPFKANVSVVPTPWNPDTRLMHIAIKGYEVPKTTEVASNIVFLIDVSGSMDQSDKLPLLKSAFSMFVDTLGADDTVSIVTYAGDSAVALEPTKASDKATIFAALDGLRSGGGTHGAAGIHTAYDLAEKSFRKDGVNRIFLATDGDFNIGVSGDEELKRLVEAKRKSGVFLSVLGFGGDNYNDGLMQTLAQNGNGVAAYIDTLAEAQKTLVEESSSAVVPIANDVKIQVEFNPAQVEEYRLIGYETRALERQDFNNDKVDAGDIGSGHSVTAIYEVVPKGSKAVSVDTLRYEDKAAKPVVDESGEMAFVKIRYKKPGESDSQLITTPVMTDYASFSLGEAEGDVRFSVAVAAFGQKLRGETSVSGYSWDDVEKLALSGRGTDEFGYRAEFLKLVRLASSLEVR